MTHLKSEITLYKANGEILLTTLIGAASKMTVSLMREDYIELVFSLERAMRIPMGAYCFISAIKAGDEKKKYVVLEKSSPTYNQSTGCYDYNVRLDAWFYNWQRYIFSLNPAFGPTQTSFSYTEKPVEHIRLLYVQLVALKQKDPSIDVPILFALHFNGVTKFYGSGHDLIVETDEGTAEGKIQLDSNLSVGRYPVSQIVQSTELGTLAQSVGEDDNSGISMLSTTQIPIGGGISSGAINKPNLPLLPQSAKVLVEGEFDFEPVMEVTTEVVPETSNEANFLLTDDVVTITYSSNNIIEAINTMCGEDALNCEWWIDGGNILHFGRCEINESVEIEHHIDYDNMSKSQSSDEYGTRLIAFGSTRNVPARYRKSLILNLDEVITDAEGDTEYIRFFGFDKTIQDVSGRKTFSGVIDLLESSSDYTTVYEIKGLQFNWELLGGNYDYITANIRVWKYDWDEGEYVIDETYQYDDQEWPDTYFPINYKYIAEPEDDIKIDIYWEVSLYSIGDSAGISLNMPAKNTAITKTSTIGTLYAFTDNFRKMMPSYFNTAYVPGKPVAITQEIREVAVVRYNSFVYDNLRYGESVFRQITNTVGEFRAETKLAINVVPKSNSTGIVNLRPSVLLLNNDSTVVIEKFQFDCATVSTNVTQTLSFELKTSFTCRESGHFVILVEYNGSEVISSTFVIEEFSITPLTIIAPSTVIFEDGVELPIVCNEKRAVSSSDEAKWLYYDGKKHAVVLSHKGMRFRFKDDDVNLSSVPVPFFTDDMNLDANIASYTRRLMLPIDRCPENHIDSSRIKVGDETIQSEVVEVEKIFEDIYPQKQFSIYKVSSFVEKVSKEDDNGNTYQEDVPFYRFYIPKNVLDFKLSYLQGTEELKCIFQDGNIAGMEFSLQPEYDTTEKDGSGNVLQAYRIIPNDINGITFPNEKLCPKAGDNIVLLNFAPSSLEYMGYVADAEQRLYDKAMAYLDKISLDSATYQLALFSDVAKVLYDKGYGFLDLGQKVVLKDETYFEPITKEDGTVEVGSRETRIIGYSRMIDIPFDSPSITLGESLRYSRLRELENKPNKK